MSIADTAPQQSTGQYPSRIRGNGRACESCSINRTTETWIGRDYRGKWWKQTILLCVYRLDLASIRIQRLTRRTSVSGGFAVVQPDSQLSINAVEGYPLEDFSDEAVKSQINEASKIANGGGSEQDIAEAKIELEVSGYPIMTAAMLTEVQVLESLQAAMK